MQQHSRSGQLPRAERRKSWKRLASTAERQQAVKGGQLHRRGRQFFSHKATTSEIQRERLVQGVEIGWEQERHQKA